MLYTRVTNCKAAGSLCEGIAGNRKRAAALKLEFSYRKDPDLCSIFLEEEEPVKQTCGALWGDGIEGLTGVLLSFSSLPRSKERGPATYCTETASAPSCTCCWGHPALLLRLCMPNSARRDPAKASPSVSHCLQPMWAFRAPSALGWEGM